MTFSSSCLRLAVWLIAFSWSVVAGAQPVIGKDYRLINPPQPAESGKRVEVLEFFWYGCPHCNFLQPSLRAWLKQKPADVEFRRVPAVFDNSWIPLTLAYYTLDALGEVDRLHDDVFKAIHEQKTRLSDSNVLFDWVAKHGVDRKKFADAYHSFGVKSRGMRSIDMTKAYDIPGTPALTVDGKYLLAPSMILTPKKTVDYERFFKVLDEVIAKARRERVGK